MSEKRKFYVTKWALTNGIKEADGCELSGQYVVRQPGHCSHPDYLFVKYGVDAFDTLAEAMANAAAKARRKLAALEKQRKRLEAQLAQFEVAT